MPTINTSDQSGRRALVVDDNPLMRVLLSSMLMHRGYQVSEQNCAEAALTKLKEEQFDLVMLDIMMFEMSGIELCQIIREELGLVDLPVVAYTAHGDLVNVAHMRMAGFTDFLFKPVEARKLDSVLQEIAV
ncbi:MAG: Response regulator receiver [Proteobacteria bacterium]|uniref:Response regulator receiver n=1 Tax=Dechloromonas aromatica (strain RCB) TaxID=159087 RepID=Q47FF4_DECAR|nr:Response regulator receiver [Pseudomonadota bacterium]